MGADAFQGRSRRIVTLAAGWARKLGATIPRLNQGQVYASKAAYQLLGLAQTTRRRCERLTASMWLSMQAPGTFPLVEDTTGLSWPGAAARRPGLGPVGSGKATSQRVLLHALVAAAWPTTDPNPVAKRFALPLLGLLDQQFHVGRPPAGTRWVVETDCGADLYERLQQCQAQGLDFVVCAARNQALVAEADKTPQAASLRRPAPSPARARLPWPCAGGPASRPARWCCR